MEWFLSDTSLLHLMKIAIKSPDQLTNSDLEDILDLWNRNGRRIAVHIESFIIVLALILYSITIDNNG